MSSKTIWLIALMLSSVTVSLAQQPKTFRINGGIQYNMPEQFFNNKLSKHNRQNEGVAFHIQPRLMINKHLTVGVNLEYAMVTEGQMMIDNTVVDAIGVFDIISAVPMANYYFTNSRVKPFVGLGLGIYHSLYHNPTLLFGGKMSAGINLFDVFELSAEYSKIGTKINYNPNARGDFGNYYFGLKGSLSIGIFNWNK